MLPFMNLLSMFVIHSNVKSQFRMVKTGACLGNFCSFSRPTANKPEVPGQSETSWSQEVGVKSAGLQFLPKTEELRTDWHSIKQSRLVHGLVNSRAAVTLVYVLFFGLRRSSKTKSKTFQNKDSLDIARMFD